ncbi:MAG: MFS transporter [Opitutales bacterium]|nr:MFS transporter [Opitutales bacterium]
MSSEPEGSLRPYYTILGFSFFNATTWMIALGTPLVLLAGELGASSFEVGLLYAFFFLLLPVQVLSTLFLPILGYKLQVVIGWSLRAAALLIPFWLALLSPTEPERWMVHALLISSFLFALFRAVGSSGIMPWLYGLIPEELRGKYFATDQVLTGFAGLLTLLLSAAVFAWLPIYEAFAWQYGYAMLGSIIAVVFLMCMPGIPSPRKTSVGQIFRQTPKLCLQAGGFRRYLWFMIASNVVVTGLVPFMAYYLSVEVGLNSQTVLIYTAFQYGGAIIASQLVRRRIDRLGAGPVFRIAILLKMSVLLFWLMMVSGRHEWAIWLPAVYMVFGMATSNWAIAHLKYMPSVCKTRERALAVSVHSSVVGVLGGIAPMVWGLFIRQSDGAPGVQSGAFAIYFMVALCIYAGLFLAVALLPRERKGVESLQNAHFLLRPMRYISHLISPISPGTSASRKEPSAEEPSER